MGDNEKERRAFSKLKHDTSELASKSKSGRQEVYSC